MTREEEIREHFKKSSKEMEPKIVDMTNILMDAYELGFKNCYEILTGTKI